MPLHFWNVWSLFAQPQTWQCPRRPEEYEIVQELLKQSRQLKGNKEQGKIKTESLGLSSVQETYISRTLGNDWLALINELHDCLTFKKTACFGGFILSSYHCRRMFFSWPKTVGVGCKWQLPDAPSIDIENSSEKWARYSSPKTKATPLPHHRQGSCDSQHADGGNIYPRCQDGNLSKGDVLERWKQYGTSVGCGTSSAQEACQWIFLWHKQPHNHHRLHCKPTPPWL